MCVLQRLSDVLDVRQVNWGAFLGKLLLRLPRGCGLEFLFCLGEATAQRVEGRGADFEDFSDFEVKFSEPFAAPWRHGVRVCGLFGCASLEASATQRSHSGDVWYKVRDRACLRSRMSRLELFGTKVTKCEAGGLLLAVPSGRRGAN